MFMVRFNERKREAMRRWLRDIGLFAGILVFVLWTLAPILPDAQVAMGSPG